MLLFNLLQPLETHAEQGKKTKNETIKAFKIKMSDMSWEIWLLVIYIVPNLIGDQCIL